MGATLGRVGRVQCLRACLGRVLSCHDHTTFKKGRVAQPYVEDRFPSPLPPCPVAFKAMPMNALSPGR